MRNEREQAGPRLRLVTAPWASLYDLPVDVVVEEQDRYRLLSLDAAPPKPVPDTFPRLVHAVDHEKPAPLGALLQGGGRPQRLRAVLLDIDRGRHVDLEHLLEVSDRLVEHLEVASVRRLGMPLLGSVHGDVTAGTFAAVFAPQLRRTCLETLYLLTGSNPEAETLRQLRTAFASGDN